MPAAICWLKLSIRRPIRLNSRFFISGMMLYLSAYGRTGHAVDVEIEGHVDPYFGKAVGSPKPN